MSNDVKVTQADEQAAIDFLRSCPSVPWSLKDELAEHFAKHILRHQPQREDVLEEAARRLEREWPGPASNIVRALKATPAPAAEREATWEEVRKACRFPCPGHYRAKVRGRFQCTSCGDILTTSEHAALTTPAPLSEHKVGLVEEAARRIYEHYEFGVWTPGKKPAWAPNGNSEMQDVARAFARAALSTPAPASEREDVLEKALRIIAGGLFPKPRSLESVDWKAAFNRLQQIAEYALTTPAPAVSRQELAEALDAAVANQAALIDHLSKAGRPQLANSFARYVEGHRAILSRLRGEG